MGPLEGVRVVEIAGIGPAPICGMVLADMGADVILVERKSANPNAPQLGSSDPSAELQNRGKRSIAIDLKDPKGVETVLALLESADALLEGFRPGVMERLGLGPDVCLATNPKLVYGRMTGWGQTGPLASVAGHDLNYLALAGVLHYDGQPGQPPFTPVTVVGDVGSGSFVLAMGVLGALLNVQRGGDGQVIDAAIVDGAAYAGTLIAGLEAQGVLAQPHGEGWLSAKAPWANCYQCADDKYISIESLEPKFFGILVEKLGLTLDPLFRSQMDASLWPEAKEKLIQIFRTQTQKEWCDVLEGTDVCFAPVLSPAEAADHPHNRERNVYVTVNGHRQPAPAPRFGETPMSIGTVPAFGQDADEILGEAGFKADKIASLKADNVVA